MASSHWAVTTRPNAAMKKKFAMYTLVVVTPRHSIRESDRVVRVVANAPIGSIDCRRSQILYLVLTNEG